MTRSPIEPDDIGALLTAADPMLGAPNPSFDIASEVRQACAVPAPSARHPNGKRVRLSALAAAVAAAAVLVPSLLSHSSDQASAAVRIKAAAQAIRRCPQDVQGCRRFALNGLTYELRATAFLGLKGAGKYFTYSAQVSYSVPRGGKLATAVSPGPQPQNIVGPLRTQSGIAGGCTDDQCDIDQYVGTLPSDTPDHLAQTIRAHLTTLTGACHDGAPCQIASIITILSSPQAAAPLRATALELLGETPGAALVGDTTVGGVPGFEFHVNGTGEHHDLDSTYVISKTDGSLIAETDRATAATIARTGYPLSPGDVVYRATRVQ